MRTVARIMLVAVGGLILTELLTRRDWTNVALEVLMTTAFWRPVFEKQESP